MVTPPTPKASSLAPSCGYQRRDSTLSPLTRDGRPSARAISRLCTVTLFPAPTGVTRLDPT
jgi:hypothetical protein